MPSVSRPPVASWSVAAIRARTAGWRFMTFATKVMRPRRGRRAADGGQRRPRLEDRVGADAAADEMVPARDAGVAGRLEAERLLAPPGEGDADRPQVDDDRERRAHIRARDKSSRIACGRAVNWRQGRVPRRARRGECMPLSPAPAGRSRPAPVYTAAGPQGQPPIRLRGRSADELVATLAAIPTVIVYPVLGRCFIRGRWRAPPKGLSGVASTSGAPVRYGRDGSSAAPAPHHGP